MQNAYLPALLNRAERLSEDALATFGALNVEQLNRQPAPGAWSIGQCFDHLMVTNQTYEPVLREVVLGQKHPSLWERAPLLPLLFGWMMVKSVQPTTRTRYKTPAAFAPSNSRLPGTIIENFARHQERLIELIRSTDRCDHARVVVTSPGARLITMRLRDCCETIVAHEERHYGQAQRVLTALAFLQS